MAKVPSKKPLLFDDVDDGEPETSDPQLEDKINKYMQERSSHKNLAAPKAAPAPAARAAAKVVPPKVQSDDDDDEEGAEGRTGITDDEKDDEGEPDYDVASRMTLKASSEAFMEVMAEARAQYQKEQEAAAAKKKAVKK